MLSGLCILYFILYCLFCICLVFPPTEFVSAGLSIDNILSSYIGSEHLQFIQFHIRKSAANLIFHSLLPIGKQARVWRSAIVVLPVGLGLSGRHWSLWEQ